MKRRGPIPGTTGRPIAERFWEKVDFSGPETRPGLGACWLWTGHTNSGYGAFRVGDSFQGAHRVAWVLQNGPIPPGMCVLHSCDVRSCVRHLFLGTKKDNARDALKKGRLKSQHHETNSNARINMSIARQIRLECGEGNSQLSVAKKFGISESQVNNIVHHRQWVESQE